MNTPIRILLVDDHRLFTEGLTELLSFHDDLAVVGASSSGERALVAVAALKPDVVLLMDLQMPGLDGVSATRHITAHHRSTAVLALTMHDDASVFGVLRAGARGYVLKGAHQDELVAALRAVARGEAVFGAPVADRVLVPPTTLACPATAPPRRTSTRKRSTC